jgi:hypothetical protein
MSRVFNFGLRVTPGFAAVIKWMAFIAKGA